MIRLGALSPWIGRLLLVSVTAAGCTGDPGYTVVIRNESDLAIIVRGNKIAGTDDQGRWLLPARSSGFVLTTLGPPREAPPIDYEIVDAESCRILTVHHVDFALAPNPGYSEFTVVVGSDVSVRLDTSTTSDQATGHLETATACPA